MATIVQYYQFLAIALVIYDFIQASNGSTYLVLNKICIQHGCCLHSI